jgi:hypothetical protein
VCASLLPHHRILSRRRDDVQCHLNSHGSPGRCGSDSRGFLAKHAVALLASDPLMQNTGRWIGDASTSSQSQAVAWSPACQVFNACCPVCFTMGPYFARSQWRPRASIHQATACPSETLENRPMENWMTTSHFTPIQWHGAVVASYRSISEPTQGSGSRGLSHSASVRQAYPEKSHVAEQNVFGACTPRMADCSLRLHRPPKLFDRL